MSSTKLTELKSRSTDNTYAPLLPRTAAADEEKAVTNLLSDTTAQGSPITLANIPLDAFILITSHLAAKDILHLGQTAQYFRLALSVTLYGSPILSRSRDILRCGEVYNETTQTLDLSRVFFKQKSIRVQDYSQHLREITTVLLMRHQGWAKTHIRTAVFPLEAIFQWNISALLRQITPFLAGVTHLHLVYCLTSSPLPPLSDSQLAELLENLEALKAITVEKVTIENSNLMAIIPDYLYKTIGNGLFTLCKAIGHGFLHTGIKCLAFTENAGPQPSWLLIFIPLHTAYPHLTMLDFSSSCPLILNLGTLPDTISCIRINSGTLIKGKLPSITRLEIVQDRQSRSLEGLEKLDESIESLPALQEVYIAVSADQPEYYQQMLKALAQVEPVIVQKGNISILY